MQVDITGRARFWTPRAPSLLLLAGVAFALTGCGGGEGGGGGAARVIVAGHILRAENNTAPNPAATVSLGGQTAVTDANGAFSLPSVASDATTLTASATGAQTLTTTVALDSAKTTNDLGNLFLSDTGYNALATGRIVTTVSGQTQPVGAATVTIAGVSVKTDTSGKFTLSGLPVGLGGGTDVASVVGVITAAGFTDKPVTNATLGGFALTAGANALGDIVISSPISGVTPLPPYTIRGLVKIGGNAAAGVTVTLYSQQSGGANANKLGTTTTDANGAYTFWVALGSYNVAATQGASTNQVSVTLAALDQPVSAPDITLTP